VMIGTLRAIIPELTFDPLSNPAVPFPCPIQQHMQQAAAQDGPSSHSTMRLVTMKRLRLLRRS